MGSEEVPRILYLRSNAFSPHTNKIYQKKGRGNAQATTRTKLTMATRTKAFIISNRGGGDTTVAQDDDEEEWVDKKYAIICNRRWNSTRRTYDYYVVEEDDDDEEDNGNNNDDDEYEYDEYGNTEYWKHVQEKQTKNIKHRTTCPITILVATPNTQTASMQYYHPHKMRGSTILVNLPYKFIGRYNFFYFEKP